MLIKAVPEGGGVDGSAGEKSGGDAAPDAADAVTAKSVQRVIVTQAGLDHGNHEIGQRADHAADNKGRPDRYEACTRRDGHQPEHGTGDECRRDQGKHHLESDIGQLRDRGRIGAWAAAQAETERVLKAADDAAVIDE